jgi:alpha-L-rhamnosidase
MVSFNHYAFGSVGYFYYAYLLGIHAEAPGFAKLRIQPVIDERIGSVDGSYESGAGLIRSAWKAENGKVEVSVTVPVDTKLVLPVGTYDLKPGSWTSHTVFDKLGSSVTDGSFFKRR